MSKFLRQQYREDNLNLGAASRVDGLEVLVTEDADALEAANPVKDCRVQWDDAANDQREDTIVHRPQMSMRLPSSSATCSPMPK